MNHFIAQAGSSIIFEILNLLFVLLILIIPFILWDRIKKWNNERNEKLDKITAELRAIREQLPKNGAEPVDADNQITRPLNSKNQQDD